MWIIPVPIHIYRWVKVACTIRMLNTNISKNNVAKNWQSYQNFLRILLFIMHTEMQMWKCDLMRTVIKIIKTIWILKVQITQCCHPWALGLQLWLSIYKPQIRRNRHNYLINRMNTNWRIIFTNFHLENSWSNFIEEVSRHHIHTSYCESSLYIFKDSQTIWI